MNGEIDFLVVRRGLILALNEQESKLAAVGSGGKIVERRGMRVIPASAGRLRSEAVSMRLANGNHLRAFFHGSVIQRVNCEAVPVCELGRLACICNVDSYGNAFAQAQ